MSVFVRTFALAAAGALDARPAAPGGSESDDACPAADPAALDDEDLLAALRAAEALGRRIDALRSRLAAEAAERSRRELGRDGLARRLGCRSHVELVQRVTGVSSATVNRRVRLGQAVRQVHHLTGEVGPAAFPAVAGALADGTLGVDAAAAIVSILRPTARVAGATAVEVAERAIVADAACPAPGAAPALDADGVRLQAQVWAAALDPDGAEPSEVEVERRGLWLLASRRGLVPVRGTLLPDVAAALRTYADACTSPRTAELAAPDGGTARAIAGARAGAWVGASAGDELPEHLLDVRSKAQQLHDVVAAIVGTAARVADAPSLAGNAPTLVITVRAEDLASRSGPAFADGASVPVGMSAAHQVACSGAIQKVDLDPTGRITGISSAQRCFTGSQRRAITVRDGGCVIPGCHVPAGWCEVHHVTPHVTDPAGTHTDNGTLLCWYHHRTLDASGWHIRMVRGLPEIRAPRWLDPDQTWRPARGSPLAALSAIAALRGTLTRAP